MSLAYLCISVSVACSRNDRPSQWSGKDANKAVPTPVITGHHRSMPVAQWMCSNVLGSYRGKDQLALSIALFDQDMMGTEFDLLNPRFVTMKGLLSAT